MRKRILALFTVAIVLCCSLFLFACDKEEKGAENEPEVKKEEGQQEEPQVELSKEEAESILLSAFDNTEKSERIWSHYSCNLMEGGQFRITQFINYYLTPEGRKYYKQYNSRTNSEEYDVEIRHIIPREDGTYYLLIDSESGANILKDITQGKQIVDEEYVKERSSPIGICNQTGCRMRFYKETFATLLSYETVTISGKKSGKGSLAGYRINISFSEDIVMWGVTFHSGEFEFFIKDGLLSEYTGDYAYPATYTTSKGKTKTYEYQCCDDASFIYSDVGVRFPNVSEYKDIE